MSEQCEALLSYQQLKERGIKYSRTHLLRLEKLGRFPRRVPLSASRIAWLDSEISDWIDELKNRRDELHGGQHASER